jgi:hypothetical protein
MLYVSLLTRLTGMIGMMGQQYPSMRYPGPFPVMEQQHMIHVSPMPQASIPPQQAVPPLHNPHANGEQSPMTASEDDLHPVPDGMADNESQTSSQAPSQMHMQQQPMSQQVMPQLGAPPNYYGHMPMHPQQHGVPYPPQPYYNMPQQMPGGPMYRQGYPIPPNMPPAMMRPYSYGPGGPGPYQQYNYEDGDGYRGGRGRGRGARGPGPGGRGAGRNNKNNMNGRGPSGGRVYSNQQEEIQQSGDSSMTSQNEQLKDGSTPTSFAAVAQTVPSSEATTVPSTDAAGKKSTQQQP